MDESKWINMSHGMELDPDNMHGYRGNENGILFLVEYLMMKDMLGMLSVDDEARFRSICIKLQSYSKSSERQVEGIFDRGEGESLLLEGEELRTPSHDNQTAISAMSYLLDMKFHKDIYKYGIKHLFRYDNRDVDNPSWDRFQHPRDIIYWSYVGGGILGKVIATLFLPVLALMLMQSCYKLYKVRNGVKMPHTDGKILTILRVHGARKKLSMKIIGWLCHKIMQKRLGKDYFEKIFDIYFKNDEHPVKLLAKEIQSKKIKWWR